MTYQLTDITKRFLEQTSGRVPGVHVGAPSTEDPVDLPDQHFTIPRVRGQVVTMQYRLWDGQELDADVLGFDTETTLIDAERPFQPPELVLATASVGLASGTSWIIPRKSVADFLVAHRDATLVLANVAFDYWVLVEYFRQIGREDAERLLVDAAAAGQLKDVQVLDMLLRLAEADAETLPRNLGQLARDYAGLTVDKDDPYRLRYAEILGQDLDKVEEGFLTYAATDPVATVEVYHKVHQQCLIHQPPAGSLLFDALQQYGVLTERIQTKSAIALAAVSRNGFAVDQDRLIAAREQAEHTAAIAASRLYDATGEAVVDRDPKTGAIKITAKGAPSIKKKLLAELLEVASDDIGLEPERTDKTNQVKTSEKYWRRHKGKHALIDAWCELAQACSAVKYFPPEVERVHPRYRLLRTGRAAASKPNIQQIPKNSDVRSCFTASPGHVLLSVDYSAIEMVTLAAILLDRYGQSVLADKLREGVDLHGYTAALFAGQDYDTFKHNTHPDEYRALRQRAKVANFGCPAGLSPPAILETAITSYGINDMTLEEAEQFRDVMTQVAFPEVGRYLEEDIYERMADNLQQDIEEVHRLMHYPDEEYYPYLIRRIVRGETRSREGRAYRQHTINQTWKTLVVLNQNPDLRRDLVDRRACPALAGRLFGTTTHTLSGRVRAHLRYTQARNTPFQTLAADGSKEALWRLFREGYRIVNYVHDEFLIELPEDSDLKAHAERVSSVMCDAMQPFVGDLPVATEYACMRHWNKNAEAVFDDDGRLLIWEDVTDRQ